MEDERQSTPLTKAALVKAWRAAKLPRLYWRRAHPGWRWDTDEIARWRDGAVTVSYTTMQAIADEIERMRE